MTEDKLISVTNRNPGSTSYVLPDRNLVRTFEYGETKKISLDELRQLSYVPGGEYILKNCLIVNDRDALSALNLEVEPEYFYTAEQVKEMLPKWTLDELEDTLNFAPTGVIDLIKKIAVDIKLPDTDKRDLIAEKTGFNVSNAIMINKVMDEPAEEQKEAELTRKVASKNSSDSKTLTRKAAAPKYKVINE